MRKQTSGPFEYLVSGRVEYLTPQWIIELLGPFDLDPCAADPRPFNCATVNLTGTHTGGVDGLIEDWYGLVWLNPPYGVSNGMNKFVEKLAEHKDGGIALLNTNTQTRLWQRTILPMCSGMLLLSGRISFLNTDGTETSGKTGSPVLVSFGKLARKRLNIMKNHGYIAEVVRGS